MNLNDYPTIVKPYIFLGVDNGELTGSGNEILADCPFCNAERKYSINTERDQWKCWVCGIGSEKGGGNLFTFRKLLWEQSDKQTTMSDYKELAGKINLLYPESLAEWGICKSILTGEWIVPAFDHHRNLIQLYRYVKWGKDKKYTLKCLEEGGLFGVNLYDERKSDLYICESWKDAIVLWETLKITQPDVERKEYVFTADPSHSMLAISNVIATPGANNWKDSWSKLAAGKRVFLMCQNDEREREVGNKKQVYHASYDGMKRIAERLALSGDGLPSEVCYLKWSEDTNIFNSKLKNGYDLRDFLTGGDYEHGKI